MAYREPAPAYKPQNVGNDASARTWENQAPAAANFQSAGAAAGGSMIGAALGGNQNWGVPDGFDSEGFLKASKANFVSLQAAWDRGDVSSLRAMTTDDMLREIQSQLAEREAQGGAPSHTEVLSPEAPLPGIAERGADYMARGEFSGMHVQFDVREGRGRSEVLGCVGEAQHQLSGAGPVRGDVSHGPYLCVIG